MFSRIQPVQAIDPISGVSLERKIRYKRYRVGLDTIKQENIEKSFKDKTRKSPEKPKTSTIYPLYSGEKSSSKIKLYDILNRIQFTKINILI